jgi:hypothetical protein
VGWLHASDELKLSAGIVVRNSRLVVNDCSSIIRPTVLRIGGRESAAKRHQRKAPQLE